MCGPIAHVAAQTPASPGQLYSGARGGARSEKTPRRERSPVTSSPVKAEELSVMACVGRRKPQPSSRRPKQRVWKQHRTVPARGEEGRLLSVSVLWRNEPPPAQAALVVSAVGQRRTVPARVGGWVRLSVSVLWRNGRPAAQAARVSEQQHPQRRTAVARRRGWMGAASSARVLPGFAEFSRTGQRQLLASRPQRRTASARREDGSALRTKKHPL